VLFLVEQQLVIGYHTIQIVRHHHVHGVQKRALPTKKSPRETSDGDGDFSTIISS